MIRRASLIVGTVSRTNDARPLTPDAVREVAMPPAARRLSTLPHIDYEEAFLVEIGPGHDRTGEQWARAILEDAPIILRSAPMRVACTRPAHFFNAVPAIRARLGAVHSVLEQARRRIVGEEGRCR